MPGSGTTPFDLDDDPILMNEEEDDYISPETSSDDEEEYDDDDDEEEEEEEEEESDEELDRNKRSDQAEEEIDGDFDRLVNTIRSRDDTSTDSGLTKDWDFNIEEQEAEFRDDLRAASGVGRRRRKGKGRQVGPNLSQQVRSLIGDGNQAYVDNDLEKTISIMQEVIRIEPRAASAWSVLAQCYTDLHQPQKALQLRIMGAHLRHDAEEWNRLAGQSRELGFNQQALYCYRKVYSLDPTNVDALWDRATLAKEMGGLKIAKNSFLGILKRFPHDLTVLAELRPILIELSELNTCANLFQQAFEHYQRTYPSGRGMDVASNTEIFGGGFGLMELLVLADLYNILSEHEHAIEVIRKGCRWFQGRATQKYWDACEDDREYDLHEMPQRVGIGNEGVEPGRFPLDINARHRLAVARIKMGEIEEGKLHANVVLSEDVLDYAPLFVEIADAYFDRELYADARPVYELLGADAATSSIYILLQTASCLRMLDELKDAAEVYEQVRIADPTHNEAKMKLAEIYELMNEPRKALDLVYEVIDSRKKRASAKESNSTQQTEGGVASTSLFEEKAAKSKTAKASGRLTHAQLRELEAAKEKEVLRGYQIVKEQWAAMCAGEVEPTNTWLAEAEKLVETFRETRNLFLTSRTNPFRGMFPRSRPKQDNQNEVDEDRMALRLNLDLEQDTFSRKSAKDRAVDVFRGISFDEWLRVMMQYCFLLTRRGRFDAAEDVLRHILISNAYQARQRQDTIRIALIACAIVAQHPTIVVEQARKLITVHQFNNEPQRILIAVLSSGLRPTDAFITSTLQKHMFREMKLADLAVKNPELLRWNPLNKRYAATAGTVKSEPGDGGDDDGEDGEGTGSVDRDNNVLEIPTKHNPIIVAIYGQICIAAKSYQSAIFYLLHAYDYCPEDPMICLSLAIASIGRAMQRQSDNRHHLVTQALAFLSQYRKIRSSDPQNLGEVEFNFGRAFHQLGIYSHAVTHYEHVLELAEKCPADENHFAREAAYNLSLIFVTTGASPLAEGLYRRWLTI